MDLYIVTLRGIRKLLSEIGQQDFAKIVDECISERENTGSCERFRREFESDGAFADMRFDSGNIDSPEKGLWTAQLFSGLVAMSAQLAVFASKGVEPEMDFIKKNFGTANEIMDVGRCGGCGAIYITLLDIDKYISKIVISRLVVRGLEQGSLDDAVSGIINLTAPEIERERKRTRVRIENSNLPIIEGFGRLASCPSCGGKNIRQGRLLRSIKENVFVPLTK